MEISIQKSPTRDYGFLEGVLSKQRARIANRLIPPALRKGRILDIGCGSYPLFLDQTDFAEKFAVDKISHDSAVSKFLEGRKISFQKINIDKRPILPFEEGYFDVVTMLAVFEHIKPSALPLVIPDIVRILKPGGIFIMTTPAPKSAKLLKVLSRLWLISKTEIEDHKRIYNPGEIVSILTAGGFQQHNIKIGFFEMFFNIWVASEK